MTRDGRRVYNRDAEKRLIQMKFMQKLLSIFAGVMLVFSLSQMRAFAAGDGLVHDTESEAELRGLLTKEHPHDPIVKHKSGKTEMICVMPRLKGGGVGKRTILLYSGSDKLGGWGLILRYDTFVPEIASKVEDGFLVFSASETGKAIAKISMSQEVLQGN